MKEDRILHIIAFNIPEPPDYGGVIDIFYKLKSLHEAGIHIILHSYQYGRERSPVLSQFCDEVNYYRRTKTIEYYFNRQPFIAVTRNSMELFHRLRKDDYPILFEGLHTCIQIPELEQENRKIIIRTHNIEHEYYSQLGKNEKNIFKKIYFYSESLKLSVFEKQILPDRIIAAISSGDNDYFNKKYSNSTLIPAFHPYAEALIQSGFGSHILYHGNLSVAENIEAAVFLISKVFPHIHYPCIIAGKDPHTSILKAAGNSANVKIVANPNAVLMDELIAGAQVNMLPAFQESGIKLKLLAALFRGRFCLANSKMIAGTGLESLCLKADSAKDLVTITNELILKPFNSEESGRRENFLSLHFNNQLNATKLIKLIWPG